MAITFDQILSYAIPIGVFVWLFFFFYSKFKDTFDLMFQKIGEVLRNMGGKTKEKVTDATYQIVYKT